MDTTVIITSAGDPSRALDSLLAQTYRSWEAIVVTDKAVAGYDDPRITFMSPGKQTNDFGLRVAAFRKARGSLIANLGDDSWWEPSFLRIMRREIADRDLLYCRTILWDDGKRLGTWYKDFSAEELPYTAYILLPSVIFRRKLLDSYSYDPVYGINGDWRFYVSSHMAGFAFGSVDRPLANMNVATGIWHYWAPGGFSDESLRGVSEP